MTPLSRGTAHSATVIHPAHRVQDTRPASDEAANASRYEHTGPMDLPCPGREGRHMRDTRDYSRIAPFHWALASIAGAALRWLLGRKLR